MQKYKEHHVTIFHTDLYREDHVMANILLHNTLHIVVIRSASKS